jgi:translation elongation factor EF-4
MQSTFGIDPADVISISAKTGEGVESVLQAILERIPPPSGNPDAPLKAFLFDSLLVPVFLSCLPCASCATFQIRPI